VTPLVLYTGVCGHGDRTSVMVCVDDGGGKILGVISTHRHYPNLDDALAEAAQLARDANLDPVDVAEATVTMFEAGPKT